MDEPVIDVEFALRDVHRILDAVADVPALRALRPAKLFHRGKVVVVTEEVPLWFIGDLHGDRLALETALYRIGREDRIVFLGDLFDDGIHGAGVVARVAQLICEQPDRICVIAGNHDEGLEFNGKFSSQVQPAEFSAWLNEHPEAQTFGESIIDFFRQAPRALILPDGLLVTHGGFPLRDRWERMTGLESLEEPGCQQDFVWTRASETARTKIPNRASKGCQFGYEDFRDFCELTTRILPVPVCRMIRGHDHVAERYLFYSRYQANPVLTINTLSHRLQREVFGPYERTPCVARWEPGQLPAVYRLRLPVEVIQEVYPEPVEVS